MKIGRYILTVIFLASLLVGGSAYAGVIDLEAAIIDRDFRRAEDVAKKMLSGELDSKTENKVNAHLGAAYLSQGKYSEAREVFKNLVAKKLEPKARDKAYIGLFDSYYLAEQYEQALGTIKKLLKISPKSQYTSLIYLKVARVNLRLAHWDDAYDYLNRIVSKYSRSLEFHSAKQLLEEKQYFSVQVGSFLERQRAQKLADELKKQDEYAYIVETTDRSGRKFYRVRVGQSSALNEAKRLKTKLARQGYPTQIYP